MNKFLIKLKNNSLLKLVLSPILRIRRSYIQRKNSSKIEIYNFLSQSLVNDPKLSLPEFLGEFEIDPRSTIFRRILVQQEYEPFILKIFKKYVNPNKDIIDVGANIGLYTVYSSKIINKNRKVLSIEPTHNAFERLSKNIIHNNVSDQVIVFRGVATNTVGHIQINTIEGKEEYSSIGAMSHPSIKGLEYQSYEVNASTIDILVKEHNLNPGFIKIDVEGAENLVIGGCSETMQKHRPYILAELSNALLMKNSSSAQEVVDILLSNKYCLYDAKNLNGAFILEECSDIFCVPQELVGK